MARKKDYNKFLKAKLQDPEVAAEYLSASIEDGSVEQFLLALRNVAEAHGGVGVLANITALNRQSMYKTLSEGGNPRLSNLMTILDAVGINLSFTPQDEASE